MILYPFTPSATITVAAPGAAEGATEIPIEALPIDLPDDYVLDFGGVKFARLDGAAERGVMVLDVDALPAALDAGDEASPAIVSGHPILSADVLALPNDQQEAQHILAELWLKEQGLRAGYTGQDAIDLTYAIALQMNAQVARGISAELVKSESATHQNVTTNYRDRYLHTGAASIVRRVTRTVFNAFEAMAPGT